MSWQPYEADRDITPGKPLMAENLSSTPYRNARFRVKDYDWDVFVGPAAGDPAVDFTVTDFDGNEIRLADFHGKWVVMETGSATCSQYSKNIDNMDELVREFPEVEFLLIYVREAHPGERLRQHKSSDDKYRAARILPVKYGEKRRILIDTLDGEMHRAYGAMPNVVYIINPDGIVHYRCDWAFVEGIRNALTDRTRVHTVEHASLKKISASRKVWVAVRTMWTGGFLALWDFIVATPALYRHHKLIDKYYDEHGKFKQVSNKQ